MYSRPISRNSQRHPGTPGRANLAVGTPGILARTLETIGNLGVRGSLKKSGHN